jgi:hypothetical protein
LQRVASASCSCICFIYILTIYTYYILTYLLYTYLLYIARGVGIPQLQRRGANKPGTSASEVCTFICVVCMFT